MRRAMVESQLRTSGVNDPRVIAAMATTPREWFVPPVRATLAYTDRPVPLGGARFLNPPLIVGRLLTEAQVRPGERVLVIGAATGYAAALLAEIGASVTAVESDPALVEQARAALAGRSVEIVEGGLTDGHAGGAPYDLILIDGAVEFVPDALVEQLAAGGRIACARIDNGVTRMAIGRKGAGGGFALASFADAEAVVLPGFERERGFVF
nr:protein-L-isoaspartate O-methyltransferase [Sphingomonas jejuensis]